jgi:hypothetical protein
MRVDFTRRADGGTTLRCVRADGSATWQNQRGAQAIFFALHDLTHYAVESELGVWQGFYGLIAAGWDIGDTGGKGARGPLPAEAILIEHLVGALDQERASGTAWPASEFNEMLGRVARERGGAEPAPLTDATLARVRSRVAELSAKWARLESGAVLSLDFDPAAAVP